MDVKLEKSPEINISFNSVVMEGGSLPQIQSDWNESNSNSRSYIKNKPTFATINGESITNGGNIEISGSDDSLEAVKLPGVNTSDGYFSSTDSALLFEGDRTLSILFTTSSVFDEVQPLFVNNNNWKGIYIGVTEVGALIIYEGSSNVYSQVLNTSSTYLLTITEGSGVYTVYVSAVNVKSGSLTSYVPDTFILGHRASVGTNFKGIIHQVRLFNYALSAEEVTALWNNGNPAGYVLPSLQKNIGMNYLSDFSGGADGWVATTISTVINVNESVLEVTSTSNEYKIRRTTKDKPIDFSCYKLKIELSEPTEVKCAIQFYFWSNNEPLYLHNIPVGTTIIEGYYVPKHFLSLTQNSYLYLFPEDSNTHVFKIKSIEVVPTYCVAEYLPGNITTSQWIDSAENNLDLTASGTPQLVNYNIYPTYKQDKLVSGENIKTINGESILGEGDIEVVPFDSPSFTGTPTAPTPSSEDNSTRIATTAFVKDQYASMVNIIPEVADIQSGNLTAFGDKWYYISQENTSGITVELDGAYIDSGKQVIIETIGATPINFASIESLIPIFIQEGVNDLHTQVSSQDIIIYTIVKAGNGFVVNGSIYKAQQ